MTPIQSTSPGGSLADGEENRVKQKEKYMRKMTYGDGQAIIILAAEKMGLQPSLVDEAKRQLEGQGIHPMTGAAMEKEAADMNDRLRHDASLIQEANTFAEEIKVQYRFVVASGNRQLEAMLGDD